jgi:hypothetical protein
MGHQTQWWGHREEAMEYHAEANKQRQSQDDQPQKPVAYDADGNPLYANPSGQAQPTTAAAPYNPAQVVHVARALEPVPVTVSDETRQRHGDSMKQFPGLNLSEHEYVISAVRRHPIGMWGPLIATAFSISLVFILVLNYPYISSVMGLPINLFGTVLLMGTLMTALFLIGGYLAIWVYVNNRFFLTNESVVQEIQSSIFSHKEQTVSLMNIEDASYSRRGPLQTILDYGSNRLSTEGEETTYRFDYVSKPKEQIAILNNAVEAFKNGRPVEGPTEENDKN